MILSKFVTPKSGFSFYLPQKYPDGQVCWPPQRYISPLSKNVVPSSMLTHLLFRIPVSNCVPAIEKTKKNDKSTRIVSLSKGKELTIATTKTCKPFIEVIALKGLSTLKALKEFKLNPPPS